MATVHAPNRRPGRPRQAVAEVIDGARSLVRLFGTVGPDSVRAARAGMDAALTARPRVVVVDLSGVDEVVDQGWALLAAMARQAERHAATVVVVAPDPLARTVRSRLGRAVSSDLVHALRHPATAGAAR